jgi:hypothetical protein
MQQYTAPQQQSQLIVPRQSHAGRNLAILFFFLIIFFAVPFVNIQSVGFAGVNVSLTGSLSYAIFHCGEVHLTGTGSAFGSTYASIDRYQWVCGNQA